VHSILGEWEDRNNKNKGMMFFLEMDITCLVASDLHFQPHEKKRTPCLFWSMLSTREKRRGCLVLFVEHNKNDATLVPLVLLHSLNPHLTTKCELQDDSLTPLSKNKNAKKSHKKNE
jgi:hypothetical protein